MEVPASGAARRVGAVLVVDDDVEVRAALAEWLRMRGHVVFEAADADQALDLLNSGLDIGVLISDVQMPGSMDGVALARWVRRTRPELRVLVLSGLDVAAQLAGEGIACFAKPPVPEALLAALPVAIEGAP